MPPGHCGAGPVGGQQWADVSTLLEVDAPDLLEQGLFDLRGQLGCDRRRIPLGQADQPSDESLGSAEDLVEVPSKKSRVVRLLLGEQISDLGQDGRQPRHDRRNQIVYLYVFFCAHGLPPIIARLASRVYPVFEFLMLYPHVTTSRPDN